MTRTVALLATVAMLASAQGLRNGNQAIVGTANHCAPAGGSDTYACTITGLTALTTGGRYSFLADVANTGAATINFTALGAKTIKKVQGAVTTDLADNDIRAGQVVELMYDGTNMQMVSQLGNAPAGGGGVTLGGAADPGTWWNQGSCSSAPSAGAGGTLYWDCSPGDTAMHGRMQAVATGGNWAYAFGISGTCDGTDCHFGMYARNTGGAAPFYGTGLSSFNSKGMYIRGLSGTGTTVSAGTPELYISAPIAYFCIADTGSTMTSYYSVDGSTWNTIATNLRSTLTGGADQIGLAIRNGSGTPKFTMRVWRLSYTASSSTCPSIPVLGPL